MTISISILGSGWLGLPLAQHFVDKGYTVNASTRTPSRQAEIAATGAQPFIVDIAQLDAHTDDFLNADVLIINITSKSLQDFASLVARIQSSPIKYVLLISSTSVYRDIARVMTEADTEHLADTPLLAIERAVQSLAGKGVTVVRMSGLIGGRRHPGNFFRNGKAIANPDAPVNLIHLDDCLGIIDAVVTQGAWGEIFNGTADSHPSRRDFYSYAAGQLEREPLVMGENEAGIGKEVSNAKVKAVLGYKCIHPDLMALTF
jgi:nucleoside-diphosphate-sugar epimerase